LQGEGELSTEETGPPGTPSEEPVQRLIDFERAVVITPMIYPPQPRLVVNGVTNIPVDVTLVPLVYVSQPCYWGIQVVGSTGDGGPRPSQPIAAIPYSAELDLAGITGTEGIEVIGQTMSERHAVSGVTDEVPNGTAE
jgi:hypothetical protein